MSHEMMVGALVISLLLNAFIGALLYLTRKSATDYFTCTGDWQQEFAKAYTARSDASNAVQTALDKIILGVNLKDQASFTAGVAEYVALRKKQDTERVKHPLPELPEEACGNADKVRR